MRGTAVIAWISKMAVLRRLDAKISSTSVDPLSDAWKDLLTELPLHNELHARHEKSYGLKTKNCTSLNQKKQTSATVGSNDKSSD